MGLGTKFIFYMVELARFLVVFFTIQKVTEVASQVLNEGETRYS